nr:amidoligase family protein [uncultured Actinoplanes sp.]
MTPRLRRRIGFEIELMAPPGGSRSKLARELAARAGGRVRPVWHHDSEPSLVPGLGRFLHLTQGYEVRRRGGDPLCTLVDDVTLLAGLDPRAPAPPGLFRILSDDPRLLALLARHSDPGGRPAGSLDGAARLWGTKVQRHGDVYRLDDPSGATIALAAPQGGERDRPCEIVTPPLARDHHARLEELLAPARERGFTVPPEAAVHLHVDGAPFRSAGALANVVRLFAYWREPLRALLQTNPQCRRLAPLPAPLVEAVAGTPTFEQLRAAASAGGLTKFFDVNLTQLFAEQPLRDTVEIRILPGSISADEIVNRAALVELLLDRCADPAPIPAPPAVPSAAVAELMELAAGALAGRQPSR